MEFKSFFLKSSEHWNLIVNKPWHISKIINIYLSVFMELANIIMRQSIRTVVLFYHVHLMYRFDDGVRPERQRNELNASHKILNINKCLTDISLSKEIIVNCLFGNNNKIQRPTEWWKSTLNALLTWNRSETSKIT